MPTSDGAVTLDIVANEKPALSTIEGLGSSLGKVVKGVGAIMGATLTAGFAKSCIEAASAAQQLSNRVAVVFPAMQDQVENFATVAQQRLGISAGTARNLMTQFGMMAQGMGMSERASAEMSAAMTDLTADMAAFYGMSTDEAASKLTGVFTGMTRGLKTLGVNMSEANLQAHAATLGITQSVSAMNQADLAALRLSYAQSVLAKTSGYAARNMNTWAGQTSQLSINFGRLKAMLGKALIVALLPVIKVINAIISGIVTLGNAVISLIEKITGKKIGAMMGTMAAGVGDLGAGMSDAADSCGDLAGAQGGAAKAAKAQNKAQKELNRTLAGFDKINKLQAKQKAAAAAGGGGGGIGGGGGGIGGVGGGGGGGIDFGNSLTEANALSKALSKFKFPPQFEKAMAKLITAFQRLGAIGKGALSWVWENILKPLGKWTLERLAPALMEALAAAFQVLGDVCDALAPIWQWLWDHLFAPLARFAGNLVIGMIEGIAGALELIHDFAQKNPRLFQIIVAGLAGFLIIRKFGGLAAIVMALGKALGTAFRFILANPIGIALAAIAIAIGYIYHNWDKIKKTKFGKALIKIGGVLKKVGAALKDNIMKFVNWIAPKLKDLWSKLKPALEKAWEILKKIGEFLADVFQAKIEAAKAVIAAFAEAWDAIKDKAVELVTNVKEKVAGALDKIKGLWDSFKDKAAELVASAQDKLGSTWDNIKDAWENFKDKAASVIATAVNNLGKIWDGIKSAWSGFVDKTKSLIATAKNNLGKTWENIKTRWANFKDKTKSLIAKAVNRMGRTWNTFVQRWRSFKDKTATLTAKFRDFFSSAIRTAWNGIARGINGAISVINKIPGVNIRSLRYLAQGGYIKRNSPVLAMVGDNRREGEVVAPESKLQSMANQAAENGGGSARVIALLQELIAAVKSQDTDVYLDGRSITRHVVRGINQQTQTTGRCPVIV